jgi:glucose-1-phosphate thymidylyltransferase
MWGIVPAAGRGSRIQPLAFSKELLPVGSRVDGGRERPCAISEYLLERMILGGADKICLVIGPGKSDILSYYGAGYGDVPLAYVVQQSPAGLCDAIFRAAPLIGDEPVLVGLPDTVWFPRGGFAQLPDNCLAFLLFPVERPEFFDAVLLTAGNRVAEIQVKLPGDRSRWIWGAFKMPGRVLRELRELWIARDRRDEYFGTLVNAYLERGGVAVGVKAGEAYVDVGTLNGFRSASALLGRMTAAGRLDGAPAAADLDMVPSGSGAGR